MQATIEIKRVDLWTLFRVAFFLYAALGLIAGIFYASVVVLIGGIGEALGSEDIPGLGLLTGVAGVILIPVLAFVYGAIGSVVVTIIGMLFNLVCRLGGGVKIDAALAEPAFTASAPPSVPRSPVPPYPPPQPPAPPEAPPTQPPPPPSEPPRFDGR